MAGTSSSGRQCSFRMTTLSVTVTFSSTYIRMHPSPPSGVVVGMVPDAAGYSPGLLLLANEHDLPRIGSACNTFEL